MVFTSPRITSFGGDWLELPELSKGMGMDKILIVENEAIIARDIHNRVVNMGYMALPVAATPDEAIDIIKKTRPDLIIMDIILDEDNNGIEFAVQIREKYNIPVVYLTAYSDEETLQQALQTEPFGYLVKPFEERELYTTIKMALYKNRIEQKLRQSESRLSITFKSISEIIIITDADGCITFLNMVAEKTTGWKKSQILGKDIETILITGSNGNPVNQALETRTAVELCRESVLITKNKEYIQVIGSISPIKDEKNNLMGMILVLRNVSESRQAEEKLKQSYQKLQRSLEGTIRAMAMIVEIRDPYTAGHQHRVSNIASLIAGKLELPADRITGITLAGIIHDLGKMYIPEEILNKTGVLNNIEFSMVKTHPMIGFSILKSIEFPWPIAEIVQQHHENFDGSGYPNGLKGDQILFDARIMMVADVIEAMSSHRPYRPAKGLEAAVKHVVDNQGVFFDPVVVDACLKLYEEGGLDFLN